MKRALQIDKAAIKSFAFLNNFILIKKFLQCKIFLIQYSLHLQWAYIENKDNGRIKITFEKNIYKEYMLPSKLPTTK